MYILWQINVCHVFKKYTLILHSYFNFKTVSTIKYHSLQVKGILSDIQTNSKQTTKSVAFSMLIDFTDKKGKEKWKLFYCLPLPFVIKSRLSRYLCLNLIFKEM